MALVSSAYNPTVVRGRAARPVAQQKPKTARHSTAAFTLHGCSYTVTRQHVFPDGTTLQAVRFHRLDCQYGVLSDGHLVCSFWSSVLNFNAYDRALTE